jgi:hypothetical protein
VLGRDTDTTATSLSQLRKVMPCLILPRPPLRTSPPYAFSMDYRTRHWLRVVAVPAVPKAPFPLQVKSSTPKHVEVLPSTAGSVNAATFLDQGIYSVGYLSQGNLLWVFHRRRCAIRLVSSFRFVHRHRRARRRRHKRIFPRAFDCTG